MRATLVLVLVTACGPDWQPNPLLKSDGPSPCEKAGGTCGGGILGGCPFEGDWQVDNSLSCDTAGYFPPSCCIPTDGGAGAVDATLIDGNADAGDATQSATDGANIDEQSPGDASNVACAIGDGSTAWSCECIGVDFVHTLPNDVPCDPSPSAVCCGPAAWPIPGSRCDCFAWGCSIATADPQSGCVCDVERADADYLPAASCTPSGGAVCCASGTTCVCGATPCSSFDSGWMQVPQCEVAALATSACASIGFNIPRLAGCR